MRLHDVSKNAIRTRVQLKKLRWENKIDKQVLKFKNLPLIMGFCINLVNDDR